jgi:very-short-patch-repair endonuclease
MARARQGQASHLDLKRRLRSDMTGPETRLWSRLRARQLNGIKVRRQHGIGPYIVDFYCPEQSLVIEVDGDSHADAEHIEKDQCRDRYLQSIGLRVVRYRNDDIMKNLDGVLEDLQTRVSLGATSPSPLTPSSPALGGGGEGEGEAYLP